MLRAIKEADAELHQDLIPACLAAHMIPRDWKGTSSEYLLKTSTDLFPILKSEKLTNRIDAFIEESAFSDLDIASYFHAAKRYDFDITVHADQYTTSGSQVALYYLGKTRN